MSNARKSGLYGHTIQGFHFELRLDVDGNQPQNQASVTLTNEFPSHWIAELIPEGDDKWEGAIWFRHGEADVLTINGELPNRLHVQWLENVEGEFARLTFLRNFRALVTFDMERESDFFRRAEFELDHEEEIDVLTSYNLHDHPNRPSDLPDLNLTLQGVFSRVGVDVALTAGASEIDTSAAGSDEEWTPAEMHDAMLANWSRPDGTPWSMWVLSAGQFNDEPGRVVFGIMFDSIGGFHRNGTAVFNRSIDDFYPASTPHRDAVIRRHKFRTLTHEIGHAFNLAHSWQKELRPGSEWHPGVVDEPEARSFMNYPGRVHGGEDAYWADFRFQFSDQELLFIRHAPEEFVAMAGADWFKNHADIGHPRLDLSPDTTAGLKLTVRFHRPRPIFEYLEPVRLEVKLANTLKEPLAVPPTILEDLSNLKISVTRRGSESVTFAPYARYCFAPQDGHELAPGEALYSEVLISSGLTGWLVSDPGRYDVVVSLPSECGCSSGLHGVSVSARTEFYVRPPARVDRAAIENLAQDWFTDDVGRVLAFGGSRSLSAANSCLEALSDRYPDSAAAVHARVAKHLPEMRAYKLVETHGDSLSTRVIPARLDQARQAFEQTLKADGERVAGTLGHLCFKQVTDRLSTELEKSDRPAESAAMQENVLNVMKARNVKLPKPVRQAIKERIKACHEAQ